MDKLCTFARKIINLKDKRMKKFLPILMILVLGLTSCNFGGEGSKVKGTYQGTFTFITDNTSKEGKVIIGENPLVQDGILLYHVLPLEYTGDNTFTANNENVEMLTNLFSLLTQNTGMGNLVNLAEENIKKVIVSAEFNGGTIDLTIKYEVELIASLTTAVRILEFNGELI